MFLKPTINHKDLIRWGVLGAIIEVVYIMVVSKIMMVLNSLYLGPHFSSLAIFLLLLVFSAGLSGLFIFGYPLYLALQKRYLEAILTCLITFATMIIVLLAIVFISFVFFQRVY
jgi:hypothetical protein